jgi:predicted nucleic acid-binding protein
LTLLPPTAVDTNILAYAEGLRKVADDEPKIEKANRLVVALGLSGDMVIAAQVFAELHNVVRRRLKLSAEAAAERVEEYRAISDCVPTTGAVLDEAFTLASRHNLQTYDAIILAAAAEAGCDILYSEDMQHGFVWRGVQVVNPFV